MAKWTDEIKDKAKTESSEYIVMPKLKEKEEIAQVTYTELPYKDDVSSNLSLLQHNLSNCMRIIDDEVMKGYVTRLEQLPVAVPQEDIATVLPDVQFFRISELVYQEDEFSVHKLSAIFHSLSNRPCTLILMIKSDGDKSDFYLGVRSLNLKYSSGRMRQMIENSLKGLFPGSKIEPYRDEELRTDMENIVSNSVSSVTCVADYKQDRDSVKNEDFIQGLEKFVDSMRGKEYTAVFLADSLNYDELNRIKSEYESIYTQISPFANMQFNLSTNISQSDSDGVNTGASRTKTTGVTVGEGTTVGDSKTFGTSESLGVTETSGTSDSVSDGTSESTSVSDGTSYSTSQSHTEGQFQSTSVSVGTDFKIPFTSKKAKASVSHTRGTSSSDTDTVTRGKSHTDTVSNSISKTLTHGINKSLADSRTTGTSESDTKSLSYNRQISDNYSDSEAFNWGTTKSLTETFGSSQAITLNAKNMTLNSVMHRLEGQLERIEQCESLGMWRFAAYFIGESAAETETAANTYHSIMLGNRSGIERSAVNTWSDENPDMKYVVDYICNFCHPRFFYDRYTYDGNEAVLVDATAMVSTNELALHMGLPRYSVKGLPVVEHAIFAQEVLSRNKNDREKMYLGNVSHLGEETATKIELDIKSLTMHAFVTGSTGAGKSNTIYHILKEVGKKVYHFWLLNQQRESIRKYFQM